MIVLSNMEKQILEILKVFGKLPSDAITILSDCDLSDVHLICNYMYCCGLLSKTHAVRPEDILYSITETGSKSILQH